MLKNKKFLTICNSDKEYRSALSADAKLAIKVAKRYMRVTLMPIMKMCAKKHERDFEWSVTPSCMRDTVRSMKCAHLIKDFDTFFARAVDALEKLLKKHGFAVVSYNDNDRSSDMYMHWNENHDGKYIVVKPNGYKNLPIKEVV